MKKIIRYCKNALDEAVTYLRTHTVISSIILLSFVLNMIFVFFSGEDTCYNNVCGFFISGYLVHDAYWHLALVSTAFNTIPFQHPSYIGAPLQGYNYLLDIGMFAFTKLGVSASVMYFKIIPVVYFVLLTILAIKVAKKFSNSSLFTGCFIFFTYFGSSLTYFLSYRNKGTIIGSSLYGYPEQIAVQGANSLLNPQFALSTLLFLATILVLDAKTTWKKRFLIGLYIFLAMGLKFYGGIVLAGLIGIYESLQISKKNIQQYVVSGIFYMLSLFISLIVFYQFNFLEPKAALVFSPFALVHSLIEDSKYFYNRNLADARYFLYVQGFSPRLLLIELYSLGLFVLLSFGTRLIGLYALMVSTAKKAISRLEIAIFGAIILALTLSTLFIQSTGWFNTIQFTYYAVFLSNIFAASTLFILIKKKQIVATLIAVLVILATLPNNIEQIHYFFIKDDRIIPKEEVEALQFLKSQSPGRIFNLQPLTSLSYIAALSGKQVYFADGHTLEITGIDYAEREKQMELPENIALEKLPVEYVYLVKSVRAFKEVNNTIDPKTFQKIYENNSVIVYKRISH